MGQLLPLPPWGGAISCSPARHGNPRTNEFAHPPRSSVTRHRHTIPYRPKGIGFVPPESSLETALTTQRGSRAEEVGDNRHDHTYREGEDAAARCLRLRWCPQAILTTRLLLHVLEGVSRTTDVDAKILTTEKKSRSPAWIRPPAPAA